VKFAKHVAIVHTGKCPDCDHIFEVDGEEFPWWITEKGPKVAHLQDMYAVTVEIYCIDRKTLRDVPFSTTGDHNHIPVFGGVEFPWYITQDGYTYHQRDDIVSYVELTFIAETANVRGIVITTPEVVV